MQAALGPFKAAVGDIKTLHYLKDPINFRRTLNYEKIRVYLFLLLCGIYVINRSALNPKPLNPKPGEDNSFFASLPQKPGLCEGSAALSLAQGSSHEASV